MVTITMEGATLVISSAEWIFLLILAMAGAGLMWYVVAKGIHFLYKKLKRRFQWH